MIKIYHNPRCKKSRAGLQYLQDKNIEHEVVLYLKDKPFDAGAIKEILKKLDTDAFGLLRTQEEVFKKQIKGKDLSDDEIIDLMVENPSLIQRPLIDNGTKAVIADPAEEAEKVL